MYVCTNYIKEDRQLRISIGRPNYNARNLEAATIILAVSVLLDETAGEGPPRFYALASGSVPVLIKSIYMTKLDRVTCAPDYELVDNLRSNVNYQSCDVVCDPQCDGGCNERKNPRKSF